MKGIEMEQLRPNIELPCLKQGQTGIDPFDFVQGKL